MDINHVSRADAIAWTTDRANCSSVVGNRIADVVENIGDINDVARMMDGAFIQALRAARGRGLEYHIGPDTLKAFIAFKAWLRNEEQRRREEARAEVEKEDADPFRARMAAMVSELGEEPHKPETAEAPEVVEEPAETGAETGVVPGDPATDPFAFPADPVDKPKPANPPDPAEDDPWVTPGQMLGVATLLEQIGAKRVRYKRFVQLLECIEFEK